MSDKKRKLAGIDLGTTYSAIAHFDEYGKADIIPNSDNERITPSVILFEDDETIVGKIAKNQAVSNPENVVQFVKRNMGETDWIKTIGGKDYTPETLSAIILKRIINDASESIGQEITDVVITVPAYFNDAERTATKTAGKLAGVNVLGLVNEPTAAILSYSLHKLGEKQKVMVYDLGGGTFDVTIVEIDGNNIKVLATDGERILGGKDWDDTILNYVAETFVTEHDIDPRDDAEAYQDLVNKVEEAKKTLSRKPRAKVFVQCGGKSQKITVTREQFEELTAGLLEQTQTYIETVFEKSKLSWSDIDKVLMVGGSTRMPQVVDMMNKVSGSAAIEKGVNPDECVAIGAVYWGSILLSRERGEIEEKIKLGDASEEEVEALKDAQSALAESIPEEIVGMLEGVVQNVNSHSLGIVMLTKDGIKKNLVMIPEQTPLPTETTKIFGTYQDNQRSVEVRVVEGDSPDPDDCTQIGNCVISDLPEGLLKGSKIAVTYRYDENGLIHVVAKDQSSGKEVTSHINRDIALSEAEFEEKQKQVNTVLERGTAGFEDEVSAPPAAVTSEVGGDTGFVDNAAPEGSLAEAPTGPPPASAEAGYEGEYAEGQYAEGYEGEYAEGEYAEGYEGEYAEGQYAEGYEGEYAEGEYAEGEYAEGYEGEYAEGQYAEGYEGEYAEGEYAEGQYAEGEYAEGYEGEYADGQYADGQYAEGQYAEGEYAEGEYAEGQYAEGQYAEGQYAEGQYAEGEYAEGEYYEGEYAEGQYAEGEYAEGEYAEGEYAEGEYAEGQYAEGYEGEYAEGEYAEGQGYEYEEGYGETYADGGNYGEVTGQFAAGGTQPYNEYDEGGYSEGYEEDYR